MNARQMCFQIADAGLLDYDLTRAIKNHEEFDPKKVVATLVLTARDVYSAAQNDPGSTWQEKRMATGSLLNTFLTALLLARSDK